MQYSEPKIASVAAAEPGSTNGVHGNADHLQRTQKRSRGIIFFLIDSPILKVHVWNTLGNNEYNELEPKD
jgi:hypothetical protein